jgi:hypothetical protein
LGRVWYQPLFAMLYGENVRFARRAAFDISDVDAFLDC